MSISTLTTTNQPTSVAPRKRAETTPFGSALSRYPTDQYTLIPLHKPSDTNTKNGIVRKLGKAPIDKNWTKATYVSATTVKRCIAEKRNVGVRLRGDQVVIDIDPRNGGDVSYLELFAEYGINEDIFPRVITGSGGLHLYATKPKNIPILDSLGDEYCGVEFKSKGRQVVSAGSLHPDTNKPYRWSKEHPPVEEAPPLPAKLLKLITKPMLSTTLAGGGEYDQETIARMLDHLDARKFGDQKKWLNLMMAVHHASNGDARSEFIEWCITDPQYSNDAALIGRRWDSLHRGKLDGIKSSTLDWYMRQEGATNAIPLKATPPGEFDGAEADASLADYPEADFDFDSEAEEFDFDTPARPKAFHYDMNKLSAMLAFAEVAMLDGGVPLYQMGERLVLPVRTDADSDEEAIRRKAGSLTLRDVSPLRLQNFMIQHAPFYKLKNQKGDTPRRVAYPAPLQLAQHYLAAGDTWRLPVLNGIVETPTLRADGTLIQEEGHDFASKLLLDFGGVDFGRIDDEPTRADALGALMTLREPFKGFPFVVDPDGKSASRAVMLAAVLTGLVRRSMPSAPMFAVSAPTAGTGKSLAIDVVSMIVAGRPAAAMSQGASEEEDEKRLLASLMRGDQILMLDNVRRAIQGDALCSILTQGSYKGRVLGESRTVEVKTNVLLMASGNGLQFAGDMNRRALLCMLDAGVERPEERRFDVDLKAEVPKRRVELVVAGLTILRAFVVAGRPGLDKLKPFGSFESWSNLVRGALVWLGESDPCITTDWIREDDPIKESLEQLLLSIYAVNGKRWFGAGELLDQTERAVDDEHDRRLDAITSALNGAKISKQSLAAYLKVSTGRIVTRMRLERARDKVTKSWRYRVAKLE